MLVCDGVVAVGVVVAVVVVRSTVVGGGVVGYDGVFVVVAVVDICGCVVGVTVVVAVVSSVVLPMWVLLLFPIFMLVVEVFLL